MNDVVRRVGAPGDDDWKFIIRRIAAGRCVPFLGAAASLGSADHVGLPTGAQLAEDLAVECGYPGRDRQDLLRVAQYFQMVYDAFELRERIVQILTRRAAQPGPVHQMIAALPFPIVLTTNFDDLMERAFVDAGKKARADVYDLRANQSELKVTPTIESPLVYKLHGSIERPGTLITTEDDVIEFLTALILRNPDLPVAIKETFTERSVLFIGYGLKDWNIRVMLRALRVRRIHGRQDLASFAVQLRPSDEGAAREWEQAVLYWDKNESLRCFDIDAVRFVRELKVKFDAAR